MPFASYSVTFIAAIHAIAITKPYRRKFDPSRSIFPTLSILRMSNTGDEYCIANSSSF
jgi:hypothetical protein